MTGLILLILLGAAGWVISLYLWPYRPCGRCLGSQRNKGSNRRRYGDCSRCGGTGRLQRIGSRRIHKSALDISKYLRGGMRR